MYTYIYIFMYTYTWYTPLPCLWEREYKQGTPQTLPGRPCRWSEFRPGTNMCGVTRLFHMCDMTLSWAWHHQSFAIVLSLFDACNTTLSYVQFDSFVCVTWLFHICNMTYSALDIYVMSRTSMSHVTHMNINKSHPPHEWISYSALDIYVQGTIGNPPNPKTQTPRYKFE